SARSALSAFEFSPCLCVSVVFLSSLSLWFSCRLCVSVIFVSSWPTSSRLAHRTLLDALFVPLSLQDVLHENSRRDDVIRIDRAGLDEALDLGDRHRGGGRHHRIEIARRPAIHEVAERIAFPRLHEREVGAQRSFEDVRFAVDRPRFLPLRHT